VEPFAIGGEIPEEAAMREVVVHVQRSVPVCLNHGNNAIAPIIEIKQIRLSASLPYQHTHFFSHAFTTFLGLNVIKM